MDQLKLRGSLPWMGLLIVALALAAALFPSGGSVRADVSSFNVNTHVQLVHNIMVIAWTSNQNEDGYIE